MRQIDIANTVSLEAELDQPVHFVQTIDAFDTVAISTQFAQVPETFELSFD